MTTEYPPEVFGEFTDEMKSEIYDLAVGFYKLGWEDATSAAEARIVDLVYVQYPEENDGN